MTPMITLEEEKRYLVLLSVLLLGGAATKKDALDTLASYRLIQLDEDDLVIKQNIKEAAWRSDLGFIRKHLERRGYLDGSIRGLWRITTHGLIYFFDLCQIMNTNFNLSYHKVSPDAKAIAAEYTGDQLRDLEHKTTFRPSMYSIFRYIMGEALLKQALLRQGCACAVCGVDAPVMLEAVRPKPWIRCTEQEKLDDQNGLLLCQRHGNLFSRGLLAFDEDGRPMLSSKLPKTAAKIYSADLPEQVAFPEETKVYLNWHRAHVFKK